VAKRTKDKRMTYTKGNVLRSKRDNRKIVVNDNSLTDSHDEYEFVCESPHDDRDFSYICLSDYCRCQQ
jgi:hypothetical protein